MTASFFFGFVAASICCFGAWLWWRVASMQRWVLTAAQITKLEIQTRQHSYKGTPYKEYVPRLEFSYQVDGRKFQSNRFSLFNFTLGGKDDIRDVIVDAKVGDTVKVYYDPAKHSRACIKLPTYNGVIASMFIGIGLLALVLTLTFANT
jgi:hypothetical protein